MTSEQFKSSRQYRALSQYYGLIPGSVGTVMSPNGQILSPPIPAFAPPMKEQTVPTYNVPYIGRPDDLQHGLSADKLGDGHFTVNNAYSNKCTTFRLRGCDGTVPQKDIPINDRCPGCAEDIVEKPSKRTSEQDIGNLY